MSDIPYDEPQLTPPDSSIDLGHAFGYLPRARFRSIPRIVPIKITDDTTAITTGEAKFYYEIPPELDGAFLIAVRGYVSTASTASGPVSIQVRNATTGNDMLSTALTIDDNEKSSKTAAAPAVVSSTNAIVKDGDEIVIDIDTAGTGAKGLLVQLTFQ